MVFNLVAITIYINQRKALIANLKSDIILHQWAIITHKRFLIECKIYTKKEKVPLLFSILALISEKSVFFLDIVLLLELLDTTGRRHLLVRLGIERMAGRADFHVEIRNRAAGFDFIAARALDDGLFVFGMDIGFHYMPLVFLLTSSWP